MLFRRNKQQHNTSPSPFGNVDFNDFESPFSALEELRRQMDQLFSEFGAGFDSQASGFSWPAATLSDAGRELTLQLQIPGVLEKDIEITSTENSVTISGERKDEVPEGYSVRRKERGALKFARTVSLPCKIQAEGIEAQLKNGVLSVSLPKAPEAQPRRISVRSA